MRIRPRRRSRDRLAMLTYWVLLGLPLIGAMIERRTTKPSFALFALFWLILVVLIGFRNEVGCDWPSYLDMYENADFVSASDNPNAVDFGYNFLNWLCLRLGWGLYGVDTICGMIFASGLIAFCRKQPLPWLTLFASVPMLIIVVAMGFTRQATAIGFLMFAMCEFSDRRLVRFLIWVALATPFHKTAIVFAPLSVLIELGGTMLPLVLAGVAVTTFTVAYFSTSFEHLTNIYITSGLFQGEGAAAIYRLGMNLMSGVLFLIFRTRWNDQYSDGRLYLILSLIALCIFPFVFFEPVAADRISMYLLPYQAAVFARVPTLFRKRIGVLAVALLILGEATIVEVWFNFANNSDCWRPYRNILFPG